MANIGLIGMRGAEAGLFIAKPGGNVLTDADADLLFSTTRRTLQPLQFGEWSGLLASVGFNYLTINHASVGFVPLVMCSARQDSNTLNGAFMYSQTTTSFTLWIGTTYRLNTVYIRYALLNAAASDPT